MEKIVISKIGTFLKTNWKDMLSALFFLVCYATSICLFLGGVKYPSSPSDLDYSVFVPLAIADIILIIIFILIEALCFKIKIKIPLIIVLLCLFVVNFIVIINTPIVNTIDYVYVEPASQGILINNEYKVMYIFCFALLLLNIYISIVYATCHLQFKKQFVWLCTLVIVIGLVFVLYSYIAEHETYKLFFENIGETLKDYCPKSLTNNENNYAAILLGAGFASFGLHVATNKKVFLILCVFFCINIVFPMSRICLVLALFLLLSVFVYKMIVSWKEHRFRNLNIIFVIVYVLTFLILIAFNDLTIKGYVEHIFLTDNLSGNTRFLLWQCAISMIDGVHRFVGLGHGYFNTAFAAINWDHVKMPHNLYLQTYGALGIVGLAALAALICYIIYKIIRLFKTNREAAMVSLIGLIIVLSYYLVEG